jgi:hypothetical protein
MKKINLLFAALIIAYSLMSCSKSTPTPAVSVNPNPITGEWAGTYKIDDAAYLGSFYYGFDIFSDSTIIETGGGTTGAFWTSTGKWSLSGDSVFTATVTTTDESQYETVQTISAKYDSITGVLSSGIWSNSGIGPHPTGTFTCKRVK